MPAPAGDGFTQFLRTRTVPILDHGFVGAVRAGRIRVVPTIESFDGPDVRLTDGSTLRPDVVLARPATGPGSNRSSATWARSTSGAPRVHGAGTLPELPGLYFVGVTVQLAGLLREIGLEAQAVGRAIGAQAVSA